MEIVFPLWKNVSIHVGEMSQKLIAFALKLSATKARLCFLRPKAACPSPKKESVAHHLGTAQFGTNTGFFYQIKMFLTYKKKKNYFPRGHDTD